MGLFQGRNFLSDHLSGKGTVGKKAWDWGKSQGFTDQQLKVAVQQLAQSGVGVNNAPGQFFNNGGPMRGVAGMHSPQNPLGKFQGSGGNFGLGVYNEAKASGMTTEEIGMNIGRSGMFMPHRAMNQWMMDTQSEANAQREAETAQIQSDMDKWKSEFQAAQVPTIQRSGNPGAVGKPGQLKIETGDDLTGRRRGIQSLSRNSSYRNSLGGVSSGAASTLNIAG
tara:strand:+ start:319 stop:987 length:669 start_codon:yes stop_codon:yes gene_type:complete